MRCSGPALAVLGLALAGCAPRAAPAPTTLHTQSFGTTPARAARTLIVVLHGDAPTAPPSDQYDAAQRFAAAVPDSVAVAILRPGYTDAAGNRSPGERGQATGDNYTRDRLAAIAADIRVLQRRHPAARTILVGHSGGAAIAANLAGTQAAIADAMLLAGCPCTLDEWRSHMKTLLPSAPFDRPVESFDPLLTAGGVSPGLRAAILVGENDSITPPRFSRDYAEALALRGVATDFRILPGRDHEIMADPETVEALTRLATALPKAP